MATPTKLSPSFNTTTTTEGEPEMKHTLTGQLTYQGVKIGEPFIGDAEYQLKMVAHDKIVAMEKEMGEKFKDFFPTQSPGWRVEIIEIISDK